MEALEHRLIAESGKFEWPWPTTSGIAVVTGGAGGGGGGGAAPQKQGTNVRGGLGGDGGDGGQATMLSFRGTAHVAAGGNGGGGGGGGGISHHGQPVDGKRGSGCLFGEGGRGGKGGRRSTDADLMADGGDGGKGFPGECRVVELTNLSVGEPFAIIVGSGGNGGSAGRGKQPGEDGAGGNSGTVLFIPIFEQEYTQ